MELLSDIDWSYRKPDANKFIENDYDLENCVTFQLIEGTYKNPSLIEDDSIEEMPIYENKNPPKEKLNYEKKKRSKKKKLKNVATLKKVEQVEGTFMPGNKYVPLYPEISTLTKAQHQICIKVIQSMNNYDILKPNKPTVKNFELETYNNLIPFIKEEQEKFLKFVKNAWLSKRCIRYIRTNPCLDKLLQCRKINTYKKYPQYYTMTCMLPLVYSNSDLPIEMQFIKKLNDSVNEETLPKIFIPSLKKKFILSMQYNANMIKAENSLINEKTNLVTEDTKCETYAIENQVNVVISSSGLKTLARNQQPFDEDWSLPLFVKNYNTTDHKRNNIVHTVAYIDKALPCPLPSHHQSRLWCYKYLLKTTFLKYLHESDCKSKNTSTNDLECNCNENMIENDITEMECSEPENVNMSSDSEEEKLIINDSVEETEHKRVTRAMKRKSLSPTVHKKSDEAAPIKDENKVCPCKQSKNDLKTNPHISNVPSVKRTTYNLWKLGQSKEKGKFSKEIEKDITLLVRCSQDGYMIDKGKKEQVVAIEPKLEYQYEFGAEVTSSNEAAKQWAMLKFRPGSDLLRTRILPCSGEIIMVEKIPLHVIQSELYKSSTCKPENILGCYFNIFSRISKLPPGQYMLCHKAKHRAFVALYSTTNENVQGGLNLEEFYKIDTSLLNETAPWSPIDPSMVTPNHIHHKIMPCMFNYDKGKLLKDFRNKTKPFPINKTKLKKMKKEIKMNKGTT